MPKVNAVICTYWEKRIDHVNAIIHDLQNGSVKPDNIFVLNNNPNVSPHFEGAYTINSEYNTRCRGKFIAALLDVADYYMLLDDDTSVQGNTLSACLEYAYPGCCFGYLGGWCDSENKGFHNGSRQWPYDAQEKILVDTFCGCGMFMSFKALANMVMAESEVRIGEFIDKWPHQGDDLIAGIVNNSEVIPMQGDRFWRDLGNAGISMAETEVDGSPTAYGFMRDDFLRHVITVLDLKTLRE